MKRMLKDPRLPYDWVEDFTKNQGNLENYVAKMGNNMQERHPLIYK